MSRDTTEINAVTLRTVYRTHVRARPHPHRPHTFRSAPRPAYRASCAPCTGAFIAEMNIPHSSHLARTRDQHNRTGTGETQAGSTHSKPSGADDHIASVSPETPAPAPAGSGGACAGCS